MSERVERGDGKGERGVIMMKFDVTGCFLFLIRA